MKFNYTGQIQTIRCTLISDKIKSAEEVAIMSDAEIFKLMKKHYIALMEIVKSEGQNDTDGHLDDTKLILIKLDDFKKLSKIELKMSSKNKYNDDNEYYENYEDYSEYEDYEG